MRSFLRPLILAFVLAFAGLSLRPAEAGEVPPVVGISSTLSRSSDRAGQLSVTATIAKGFHIYAQSQPRPFLATKITVVESPAVRVAAAFTPSRPPRIIKHSSLGVPIHEYEGQVTWIAPVEFSSAPSADLVVQGTVFAQACQENRCLAPRTYEFKAPLRTDPAPPYGRSGQGPSGGVADVSNSIAATPHAPTDAGARTEARQPADRGSSRRSFSLDQIEVAADGSGSDSVWAILPLAFVAGFLLNFMPCVLPVVGLKLLSFVQQSNESRRRILLLNVAYSAGLMFVMLMLATFAVFAGLGWGQQFSSTTFSVTLAATVFAFGLSFLDVWEVPMPGFVGSAGGSTVGEGYGGAFSKGVLSTLLATPCSGPFLGSALAWAIVRPAYLTYAVFAFVALGMASPYLLVGLFPRLVQFLPRPGNWMVTFKQIMGFVLLATVVYLLSFIPAPSVVPTVLVLLGVGFGCWWVGPGLLPESRGRRLRAWVVAAGSVAATACLSFGWLEDVMAKRFEHAVERKLAAAVDPSGPGAVFPRRDLDGIAWEPFSKHKLEELVNGGKTVFVDFTADWCLTCKANEAAAIERPEVARLIRENGVVALKADKTNQAPEVDDTLRRLGNKAASIPFYAIFPSDTAIKPILLDGLLTSPEPIVQAFHQAGPSSGAKLPHRGRTTEQTRVSRSKMRGIRIDRDALSSMEVVCR
jgi:suppressor for copper-sensitivity B